MHLFCLIFVSGEIDLLFLQRLYQCLLLAISDFIQEQFLMLLHLGH